VSVAAASVVAKVTRDRIMDRYHRRFPNYGFDHNRGYGTAAHWDALWRFGPSPIHRRSFNHVVEPLSPQEYAMLFGGRGRGRRAPADGAMAETAFEGDEG
jgi:ribonuclease HII